jgi:hypothetical protein
MLQSIEMLVAYNKWRRQYNQAQSIVFRVSQSWRNMKWIGSVSMVLHGLWWKSQALKEHLTCPTCCSAVTAAAATKSSIATMAGERKICRLQPPQKKGSRAELPEQVQGEVE